MLGLYVSKHLVGESEIEYHLGAQKHILWVSPFYISIEWDSKKSIVALKGKLLLKHMKMLLFFRNRSICF